MRKFIPLRGTALALSVYSLQFPAIVMAQDVVTGDADPSEQEASAPPSTDGEIAALRSQIDELQRREALALERLRTLEERLERLELLDDTPISAGDAAAIRGRYVEQQNFARPSDPAFRSFRDVNRVAAVQDTPEAVGQAEPVDRKAPAPTAAQEDITQQQLGTFGRNISFDLGLSYTHFDNARINLDGFLALDAIFLGSISIDRIQADIFAIEPSVDVGLSDRLFVDASLPLLSRTSNFQSGGVGGNATGLIERSVSGTGVGDASVGLSYRLLPESLETPDLVLNTRVKFPTGRHPYGIEFIEVEGSEGNLSIPERLSFGTGVYGASVGLSVLKSLDPMIVFGSATYFHNFKRDFDDIDETPGDQPGEVKLGNAYQIGAGLAFALNDRSSISMSYTQRIVERTKLQLEDRDERLVVGSQANVALANFGATFSLDENVSLVTNLGIGLTDDSPDMSISIRIPYRF